MKERKKILWLTSWYPNRTDRFDGDFIQRHARAAAIFHDIHVIHVAESVMEPSAKDEWNFATGLTEQVIYFRKASGIFSRFKKFWKWKQLYQQAIQSYIEKNGLPDLVHVHVPWKAGLLALWMKRKYGTSFIISEHWGIYDPSASDSFFNRPALSQKLLKDIYRESSAFITVSEALAKSVEAVTQVKYDRIIPNVVDTTLFHYRPGKYSRFSFIHVSNMVPLKNAGTILQAFHELVNQGAEAQLIMIGNRDDQYVELAGSMGILNQSVFFRGEISYNEVAEEVRRSHCFVLFSDSETFSCVVAEALCAGLPVITSRVGALPELVHERNGILVNPGETEGLLQAMKQIIGNYEEYDKLQMAREATEKYGYPRVAEMFDELYASQLNLVPVSAVTF